MKQGLSLRVSQHLALTPQLQQSIRLLQLSTLELSQEVEQMLDDNPFLEREEEAPLPTESGPAQADSPLPADDADTFETYDAPNSIANNADSTGITADSLSENEAPLDESWDGDGSVEMAPDDSEWGSDAPARTHNNEASDTEAESWNHAHESLQDHLHAQARHLRLSAQDRAALHFLIESLTDDGYLDGSLLELAQALLGAQSEDIERVEEVQQLLGLALRHLHQLEPAGVGARDLGECLQLQIQALPSAALSEELRTAALAICAQPMDFLARRDFKRLVPLCKADEATLRLAVALIGRLEPKPGRRFVDTERNLVVPDVLVVKTGRGTQSQFRAQLNADVMPKLKVHDIYANALRGHKGGSHAALQQRLQEARWFIKNVQQRFDTILRVSNAIIERQKNFFTHGELAMRPLVLREIADELGLHESTISRVTTAKYMSTPFGTFELKYFFGSALGTETGGNASSTAVRALIKQFVAAEDLRKPLSDSKIADMLKEQGIECARRTVAKYREALRIAPANLRKAL